MGSATVARGTLPIIDIAPWLEDDYEAHHKGRLSTAAAIHAACLEYGFFYLNISSLVDSSEPNELARLAREFFALPQEEKEAISLSSQDHARGYQRLKENVTNGLADNHEAIDFYRPVESPDKSKPLWGENQWPPVPQFQEKYNVWTTKMKKLGLAVMEAMAAGLGMSPSEWKELLAQVDESFWVMRIIGYPPLPNDEEGFSCGAHKDYGCLTFLWADSTTGALQVFLPQQTTVVTDGNQTNREALQDGVWISADPIPDCLVCNIGEMWEIWTNGLYKSTLHRVIHRSSNYRIPFFYEPNFDALIAPLPAALRLQNGLDPKHEGDESETKPKNIRDSVVYGEFLMKKVGSNFSTNNSRYGSV